MATFMIDNENNITGYGEAIPDANTERIESVHRSGALTGMIGVY